MTFEPSQNQSCFDVNVIDDNEIEMKIKTVTFFSPGVGGMTALTHEVFILDNDCELNVWMF